MADYLQPESLLTLLMGEKAAAYITQAGKKKTTYIRLNPLKANPEDIISILEEEGFKLTPLDFYPYAYEVSYEPFPISKGIAYFGGLIYLQDPSSMLPALVLNPSSQDTVLDLTAAPGSKTTLLATLMKAEGILVACDSSAKRLRALSFNLERWGAINAGWARLLGEQIGNLFFERFDKVLVDPPCSALGTLSKSPEILRWWKEGKVIKLARMQERLLISGLKALKPGGTLVYSTCTLTPHENEAVIQAVLERYPVVLEDIKIPLFFKTRPGLTAFASFKFSPQMQKAVRIYPIENPSEGFFIAKIKKKESFRPPLQTKPAVAEKWLSKDQFKELELLSEHFGFNLEVFDNKAFFANNHIRFATQALAHFPSPIALQKGISFARPMGQRWRLTTNGITLVAKFITQNRIELDRTSLKLLIAGHVLPAPEGHQGQQLLVYKNCALGYGWIKNRSLISQLPSREVIV